MTIWAGERGFEHRITATNAEGLVLVTGLPRKPGLNEITSSDVGVSSQLVGTWGHQVLMTGANATDSLPDQNLGLMIFLPPGSGSATLPADADNHLAVVKLNKGTARWYIAAAWDQEGSESIPTTGNVARQEGKKTTPVWPLATISTREDFISYAKHVARSLNEPAEIALMSKVAAPQIKAVTP